MMRTWGVQSARFRIGFAALIILSLASGAGALSNSGGGSWWYYRDITISNTGSDLTDYQVLVSLNSGNFPLNAQTNGADIRFTDAGGDELSYWIESWDYAGRNAKIWVNVTSIVASGSTGIRMHYGNPSAASASNGMNTFEFFDGGEGRSDGASLSTEGWTTWGQGTYTEKYSSNRASQGSMSLYISSYNANAHDSGAKRSHSSSMPFVWELDWYDESACNYTACGPALMIIDSSTNNSVNAATIMFYKSTNPNNYVVYWPAIGSYQDTGIQRRVNQWVNVKIVINSSGSVDWYVNGVKSSINAPAGTVDSNDYIALYSYQGGIAYHDNDRVRKFASPEPFATIGAEETYGLVGYWRFDEGANITAADSSGNGNNGTLYNFNWDANSNWVEGKFGKALRFDGSNDYVSIPDAPSFTISEVTLEAWIKPDDITGYHGIVTTHKANVDSDGGWVLFTYNSGASFVIFTNSGEQPTIIGGSITPGSWYHVVGTWNSSSGSKVYLNGVNVATTTTTGTLPDPANPIEIGRYHTSNGGGGPYWFDGAIDEVRIYNRSLSAEEIKAHYEQGAGAPMGNSIGYSAIVATGQITSVVATNGSFGLIPKSQTKTINNSVTLNNTGDISARVEARFNDSIVGVFGLISGTNVLNATNFALGIPGVLMPLNNSGTDVQVAIAPPGVTAMDARLGVPNEQAAGDYTGTVIITFSNNV